MNEGINEFLELFLQESSDRFEELSHELVALEESPSDEEVLYSIMRHMHSIKGSAGMFGFDNLKLIGHRLEDLCEIVHKNPSLVNVKVMDTLFAGTDLLHSSFKKIAEAGGGTGALTHHERLFLEELDEVIQALYNDGLDLPTAASDLLGSLANLLPSIEGIIDLDSVNNDIEKVKTCLANNASNAITPDNNTPIFFNNIDIAKDISKLENLIDLAAISPLDDANTKEFFTTLQKVIAIIKTAEIPAMHELLQDITESISMFTQLELDFDNLQSEYYRDSLKEVLEYAQSNLPDENLDQEDIQEKDTDSPKPSLNRKTVRVEEAKIDKFLDNVGELIILGEIFNNLQKKFSTIVTSDQLELVREFSGANNDFSKQVFGLQKSLMDIRRIEISTITNSITRLVRDTARSLNKEIGLEVIGEDAVIDKSLLDDINTCLVHIVRNSCDHGIETPEERKAAGKESTGHITLSAVNEDNSLILKVRDDGKGIDTEKIGATAISSGIYSQSDIDMMSERQIMELIFQNGFSTAKEVSDISGRGIGMSSVLDNIKKSGGLIEINSEVGQWTLISIKIPLSIMLSVVDGLVVKSGGETFIIPIRYVVESFYLTATDIINYQNRGKCAKLRNEVLPVIKLDEVLDLNSGNGGTCVVIKCDASRFCLVVDEILDHQQVVIKRINGLESVRGIMGGALLGDGTVGLVLNIDVMGAIFID